MKYFIMLFTLLTSTLPATAQKPPVISNELNGIIDHRIEEAYRKADTIFFNQGKPSSVVRGNNYKIVFDKDFNAMATKLPPTEMYKIRSEKEKVRLLAILPDGSRLESNRENPQSPNLYNGKALENIYLNTDGKRKLVWKGQILANESYLETLLSPDGKTFIWRGMAGPTRSLSLTTGEVKIMEVTGIEYGPFSDSWVASNNYLFLFGKTLAKPVTYSLKMIDIHSGLQTSAVQLKEYFTPSLIGNYIYTLSPDDYILHRFAVHTGKLTDSTRVYAAPANMPYAYGRGRTGRYNYIPVHEDKILLYPTASLDQYFVFKDYGTAPLYNPSLLLYNVVSRQVEKVWPDIMKGAPEKTANYAAYRHKDVSEPVQSIAASTTIPKSEPAPAAIPMTIRTTCPNNTQNERVFPIGTFKSGDFRTDYIVVGYDCANNKIVCLQRDWTEPKNTFFKTDANIGFYSVKLVSLKLDEVMIKGNKQGQVKICPVCTGTGIVQQEVVRARGGKWEDYSSTIKVYTPYHEIARWKERAKCPACDHTGYRMK